MIKTQKNSVSQKIWILHKINNEKYILNRNVYDFWKVCWFLCTRYLVGPPFAWITASLRRGMESISLWHCSGVMEAQVTLIAAFRSSALLGLVSLIFIDSLLGSGQASLLANQAQYHHGHWISFWYLWQFGQGPSPPRKWNRHLHKACQQKEAWSALKFPGRWQEDWLWTSEKTVDQHQQMTCSPNHHWLWTLHTGLQETWILCLSTLPPDSGTLMSKLNAKFTFIWKEDFGPPSNSPVIFLLSPVKMLLKMFLFQKWFGGPFPEDVWAWWLLMHWLQLQLTPCEALPSV